jgi:DNA helicase-2/ATP-dependent DNA helicase PcrA
MPDESSLIPEVTDEDIDWVRGLMRLDALDQPRRAFLTKGTTVDVAACPGSGKTTLIVAKLAILARKWPHRSKGICVLSHTNVAREEIERCLGSTVVGQRLLGYPHFIDTIHGFVNRFLALPWLLSNGYPPPTIDNDITAMYRRRALDASDYWKVQNLLTKRHSDFSRLRICGRDLRFDLGGKPFPAGEQSPSFAIARRAVKASAVAGYFCHDEMFVWARALLEDVPAVASWLRRRFPLVLLDEMQDTFALQGELLHSVFPRSAADVVVQRVGDPNQAIFDDADAAPDKSDPFPDTDQDRCLDIPNSLRFGPQIAALASPFAVKPVGTTGLCGIGPREASGPSGPTDHAIFVFPDNATDGVLEAYGTHVLAQFDDATLMRSTVTAVGAVHQDARDVAPGHAHFPKSVPHYWAGYTAEASKKEPHPKTLVQYLRAAQTAVRVGKDLSPGVERVASGLVRLAGRVGDARRLKGKPRTHRAITQELDGHPKALSAYRRLLKATLLDRVPLTENDWAATRADSLAIGCALCEGATDEANATDFLAWVKQDALPVVAAASTVGAPGPNVCRVTNGPRSVDISLGSIHSVKGQTHLATLVLSTHWHEHSSEQILEWLLGTKVNDNGAGHRDRRRLLQTYVAMTRPTHMICLALRRSTFGNEPEIFAQDISRLSGRGWRVAEIVNAAPEWRA